MTDREVMQMALEALEHGLQSLVSGVTFDMTQSAIKALRARLAEPEPEPVAWMDIDSDGNRLSVRQWSDGNRDEVPLYTTPPARRPLTDEEIHDCFQQRHMSQVVQRRMITRAIERKITGGNDE